MVRAYDLQFTTEEDCWGEYTTDEGYRIKMRSVVARIYRLIDRFREDGTPIHILHGSVVLDTALVSNPTGLVSTPEVSVGAGR
jgi:hypothetical protein